MLIYSFIGIGPTPIQSTNRLTNWIIVVLDTIGWSAIRSSWL